MFISALVYLAAAGVLAMWLAWAGLRALTGRGEPPGTIKNQATTLGIMLALGVGVFFVFGLAGKMDFDHPALLPLVLIALPLFILGAWSLQQLGPARRWASVYLRVLVLLLIVSMLVGFRTVQRHDELTVVALIDTSESVRRFFDAPDGEDGAPRDFEQWVGWYLQQAAADKPADDYWSVQTFDGRPTIRLSPSLGEVSIPATLIDQSLEGSNGQRAIESGMAAKQHAGSALRMVLVSDGNLSGEVMTMVQAAAAAGVQIDVLPLDYQIEREVMIEAVHATPESREGQTVRVSVDLRSADRVPGTLQLRHNGTLIDLNGQAAGVGLPIPASQWQTRIDEGSRGDGPGLWAMTVYIDRPISEAGVNTFDAVFIPDDGDEQANAITANDRGQAFTLVAGQGRILVVDGVGGQSGNILRSALQQRGFDVDSRPVTALPGSTAEMRPYDAILFQNVSAADVPAAIQDELTQYVHNLGGGFAMIGGPDSFGAGGWTNSDIDRYVLPVSCEIPSQREEPSGALILLIDSSGSMFGEKEHVAAEAAVLALETLYPEDLVGVITFDSRTHWIQRLQRNSNPQQTAERIRAISSGGGTDIDTGLNAAYHALRDVQMEDAAIRHVILVTDGWEQVVSPSQTAQRYREAGISLTTIGIGPGNNSQLLQPLATMAGGTYHNVVNPNAQLPQVFIKEASFIRRNLVREETFTPTLRNVHSPIMVNVNAVPPLHGFVRTVPKPDRVSMPIVGPEGEPIFAHHQAGLGRAAAFTSDATNRWANDWLDNGRWSGPGSYADFWASTVRHIARPPASTQADLMTFIEGDTLTMRLDAAGDAELSGESGGFGNNLAVAGAVQAPDGTSVNVELQQVGPGIYEARIPAPESGNYIVDLTMQGQGGQRMRVIGGASRPAGGELRDLTSNRALLNQIAEATGGRVLDPSDPEAARLFERTERIESISTRPLRWQLMPFLLALLVMDVACRRIAWEGREVADWARGRANAVLGLMQTRQVQGESTMAALKAKRQQTSEQLDGQDAAPPPTTALGGLAAKVKGAADAKPDAKAKPKKQAKPAATTSRTRKFVASEEELASAGEDFSDAVGGAKNDAKAKPAATQQKKTEKPKDEGPTTSRLLDAKRRAQQRMNDEED